MDAALSVVLPAIMLVIFVAFWDWAIVAARIPETILPRPGKVLGDLWYWLASGLMTEHLLVTLLEVLYGFIAGVAGGLLVGVILAEFPLARMTFFPFVISIQMIPKVAIAPLFIMWLGYGISSKVAIAASITFFPIVINTMAGLRSVDSETLEMMRAFRATRWQTFHRVKLRYAAPYIFASLEVAMVLAIIGAIVAEFLGATKGLGYMILQSTYRMEAGEVFAMLIVLAVLGVVLNGVIRLIGNRVLFWHHGSNTRT